MRLESSSIFFTFASLICSGSFWLAALLTRFPRFSLINLSDAHWFQTLGLAAGLAIIAGVLNFEKKLWIFALLLALLTLLLNFYASVS